MVTSAPPKKVKPWNRKPVKRVHSDNSSSCHSKSTCDQFSSNSHSWIETKPVLPFWILHVSASKERVCVPPQTSARARFLCRTSKRTLLVWIIPEWSVSRGASLLVSAAVEEQGQMLSLARHFPALIKRKEWQTQLAHAPDGSKHSVPTRCMRGWWTFLVKYVSEYIHKTFWLINFSMSLSMRMLIENQLCVYGHAGPQGKTEWKRQAGKQMDEVSVWAQNRRGWHSLA